MTHFKSYRWVFIIGLLSFVLAGCFQSVSDDPNVTPQSLPFVTDTFVPSQVPLPTYTLFPTFTPFPTNSGESLSVDTDPLNSADVQQEPTFDPLLQTFPTATTDPNIGSGLLTATAIIQQATDQSATQTATFTVQTSPIPTFTPTIDPTFGQQPIVPTLPGTDCIYEVRTGDNMWQISQTFGVLMVDIANASGVAVQSTLLVGQRLTIPNCGTTGAIPPATSTPRATITPDLATSGGQVVVATPVVPFTLAPVNCTVAGGITHTVSQGETLFQIAQRYGTSLECVLSANPEITNPGLILFGDQVFVP